VPEASRTAREVAFETLRRLGFEELVAPAPFKAKEWSRHLERVIQSDGVPACLSVTAIRGAPLSSGQRQGFASVGLLNVCSRKLSGKSTTAGAACFGTDVTDHDDRLRCQPAIARICSPKILSIA